MLAASKWEEAEKIKKQLAGEKARLAEEKEEEKEKVRRQCPRFSRQPELTTRRSSGHEFKLRHEHVVVGGGGRLHGVVAPAADGGCRKMWSST